MHLYPRLWHVYPPYVSMSLYIPSSFLLFYLHLLIIDLLAEYPYIVRHVAEYQYIIMMRAAGTLYKFYIDSC